MNNRTPSPGLTLIGASPDVVMPVSLIILQIDSYPEQQQTPGIEPSRPMRDYSYAIENYSPERGNIYDRWGRLMAGNEDVYEVGRHVGICYQPH